MTGRDVELPAFTVAVRGYDRRQVVDYVRHLQRYVTELEDRLARAERGLAVQVAGVAADARAGRLGGEQLLARLDELSGTPGTIPIPRPRQAPAPAPPPHPAAGNDDAAVPDIEDLRRARAQVLADLRALADGIGAIVQGATREPGERPSPRPRSRAR